MKRSTYRVTYIGGSILIPADSKWEAAFKVEKLGYHVLAVEVI